MLLLLSPLPSVSTALADDDTSNLAPQLQSVQFPAHANAQPGEEPRCKGFALVVFEAPVCASGLVSAWPWSQSARPPSPNAHPLHKAALKSGLRCLSLTRFEELQQEYLDWQQQLVSDFGGGRETHATTTLPSSQARRDVEQPIQVQPAASSAAFPRNQLVIARHVPIDSTKTSLRSLFEQALPNATDAIQYIDYVKNCDWVRVSVSTKLCRG